MEMTKINYKTKCDFPGCKFFAEHIIKDEIDVNKKLNLCESCLIKIYEVIAKTIVPKGVDSPFKKQRKLR